MPENTIPTPERVLALQGALNFRDLGGYRTVDGGQVRWGQVFRSDALHRLTSADLEAVELLGLRVVYDLRGEPERIRAPSLLPGSVRCELLPIGGTAGQTKELTYLVAAGRLGDVPVDFLERVYEAMAEMAAPTFGRLLTGLAEADGLPALVHCTAGKDRTGMAAALLLSVLGIDEATVLDDYELSSTCFTDRHLDTLRARLDEMGIDAERYRTVFGAPRHAMARLLATLRQRHGSVEGYLRDEADVAPEVFAELRARLVERVDPVDRVGTVDQTDTVNPVEPVDPVDQTDPVDPGGETDPVGPVGPVDREVPGGRSRH